MSNCSLFFGGGGGGGVIFFFSFSYFIGLGIYYINSFLCAFHSKFKLNPFPKSTLVSSLFLSILFLI